MSLVTVNFESQYLKNNTEVSIILPDRPRDVDSKVFYDRKKRYPVLWLLHGTFGDHTDWLRHTNIELYACENDVIVVMPSGLNSDYVNWDRFATQFKMFDFLTEELMPMVYAWYPASDKREDNFIAGLSMGGAGALLYAANHPDKFAAVSCMSCFPKNWAVERQLGQFQQFEGHDLGVREQNALDNGGGREALIGSYQNTWRIIDEAYPTGKLPRIYMTCGDKDSLVWDGYAAFKAHCMEAGMTDIVFEELPGFQHEWRFWDIAVQNSLKFFGFGKGFAGNLF